METSKKDILVETDHCVIYMTDEEMPEENYAPLFNLLFSQDKDQNEHV